MRNSYILLVIMLAGVCSRAEVVPRATAEGFRVPQPGTSLVPPEAHRAHPQYKIEWWYLTGHLQASSGRRFGYQATFFRYGLKPADVMEQSPFGTQQVYLTHMALTDIDGEAFHYEERLARNSWDAYASQSRLDVRNGNWRLYGAKPEEALIQLAGSIRSEASFDLQLSPAKKMIQFGPDGTSRKGPDPAARSYYLSYTRMVTRGTVSIGGETFHVNGSSWMDHEIASSQLDPSYTGWDWIAIQLKDGWEVKAYLLREANGTPSPYSATIWIDPSGKVFEFGKNAFQWEKGTFWKSDRTSTRYPIEPGITTRHPVTQESVFMRFVPLMKDQELALPGATYWEGAGDIVDENGHSIGSAYLELVGYGGAIRGLQ